MDDWFKYRCAHEFGHVLGLWDAYGNENANEGYQISQIVSPTSLPNEFYNYDIMTDHYYYYADSILSNNVTANDIEMMLDAFIQDDWQYFYQGKCTFYMRFTDQKLSNAIKHPKPTYEKKGTLNWDYFYWDRDKEKNLFIANSNGFPTHRKP